MNRRRTTAEGDERGFTLIETLVAMLVFTIFAATVTQIYVSMVRQENGSETRFSNTGEAQTIMDRLTSELRSATYCTCGGSQQTPIASGDGDDITFYASLGGSTGPTKIQFQLSGTSLTETDTPASGGAAPTWSFTGPATTSILNPTIGNSSSSPLFTYYTSAGGTLTTPLSSAQTVAVESIGVNLVVGNGSASTATLHDQVHLSNVDFEAGNG